MAGRRSKTTKGGPKRKVPKPGKAAVATVPEVHELKLKSGETVTRGDTVFVEGVEGRFTFLALRVPAKGSTVKPYVEAVESWSGHRNGRCFDPARIRLHAARGASSTNGKRAKSSATIPIKVVKATADEIAKFKKVHKREVDCDRAECGLCGQRVWATPVGLSTHARSKHPEGK